MSKYDRYLVPSNSPILKLICAPVGPNEKIAELCRRIERVCKKGSRLGVGLAAPQVGVAKRLIFVNCASHGTIRGDFMVNPVITRRSAETNVAVEGCLSYPGKEKMIARPDWIEVEFETPTRARRMESASGYRARVICHEVDHLDGVCRVGDDSPPDADEEKRPGKTAVLAAIACVAALPIQRDLDS